MRRAPLAIIMVAVIGACAVTPTPVETTQDETMITQSEFEALLTRVSEGWTRQDTELALSAFADDALYTEPPDLQIYRGAEELRIFFDRVAPGATMIWQNLWYDPATGFGAGEYSFKNGGRTTAVHGVAVVEIVDGKIRIWREYQRRGDIDFDAFHDPDTKDWRTTVDDL